MSTTVRTIDPRPVVEAGARVAALPFDAMRFSYATAVQRGLVRRSMLDSRDVEKALGAMERALLGPLARKV